MEALPDDPNLLKEKLVASNLENAELHLRLDGANETIHQLRRDKQTLMGEVKIWKDATEGVLGHDEAVEQLAEANATVVGAEFDILAARSVRGTVRQLTLSLNQLRQTTAMQMGSFLRAKKGEFAALERVHDLEETVEIALVQRNAMAQGRDEAVKLAESTATLRHLYDEGIKSAAQDSEQAKQDVEQARGSEAAAWRKVEQLSGVEARNQQLEEENAALRVSEAEAKAQVVEHEETIESLRQLLVEKEKELGGLSQAHSGISTEVEGLQAEIKRLIGIEAGKNRLAEEAERLRKENRELHSTLGGIRVQRGITRVSLTGVVWGMLLKSIPFFGPRIAEEISRQSFKRRR